MTDEFLWEGVRSDVVSNERVTPFWLPTSTYSAYRGKEGMERYGRKDTPPNKKELVRLETLHAVRVAKLISDMERLAVPWAAAAPVH